MGSKESSPCQGSERACRLCNTIHSEVAPTLPLPICLGSADQQFSLSDAPALVGADFRPFDRPEVLAKVGIIADLLRNCDINYLNLKENVKNANSDSAENSQLHQEVLNHVPGAFECSPQDTLAEQSRHNDIPEKKPFEHNMLDRTHVRRSDENDNPNKSLVHDPPFRKTKVKKKQSNSVKSPPKTGLSDNQDTIGTFCDMVEDLCSRAEISDEISEAEGLSLSLTDVKTVLNEIMMLRSKKLLQSIPVDSLSRLIHVLDRQIQCSQGVSINGNDNHGIDALPLVLCALESTHATLAVMAYQEMPKQLYREEVIERILDFSRYQISESMAAYNPLYSNQHNPSENCAEDDDDAVEEDFENNSVIKRRRIFRTTNAKKSVVNKVSQAVYSVIQKLCSILDFLKDLLSVERLSDSCILQLVKTSFSTFLVDECQLLQMKSINLICGVHASYAQHRSFLMDEILQLLRKLQFSKRAVRTYHLPDVEQKQIQMITGLFIQLVQFSISLPENIRAVSNWNNILDTSWDPSFMAKSYKAATEVCCIFWTNVLQRLTTAKAQDVSESKVILENLVMDLLTTLNLPEYPASASILEVLCVLLLQNAGLKSKDVSARCMAVDLLGTIAARLKRDAAALNNDKFWILKELADEVNAAVDVEKDSCSVCLNGRNLNIICHLCKRCFHEDCAGTSGQEMLHKDWSCHICLCKKQLSVLRSYCSLQRKEDQKKNPVNIKDPDSIAGLETIQQILLNYLQENNYEDDDNLFTRWFYLCVWHKDDSPTQDKVTYYIAKLKSKAILRDSGIPLKRDWAKKICLALGQKSSFSRGFDTILSLLLATMRENSPVLRAKALRAVSSIVEADPEVLCDKRVQSAVEGRFCDSAISVREAALELVGRHIASHPDVGLKYFGKVAERIKDTGVSVRKRAVKIIRDLCTSNAEFAEVTHAFIAIISRVTDEESSVQDLVCKTFYELWFEEPTGNHKHLVADGSSVPLEVAKKTEQIVDMLRKMANNHLIVTIIKRNLALDFLPQSAKASGISTTSLASVRRRCEMICKCLLERILQVEDCGSNEEDVRALPYVLALHSFCVVDPMLCAPATNPAQFVITLQPYLKNQVDNKANAQLLESIIFIIDSVLPFVRKPPQSLIEELEQDMKHMIVRHTFLTVVHACIKCLCSLSKVAGKGSNLVETLIHIFIKHLHGPIAENKQLVGRSLFCLGLLLRYGNELIVTSSVQHLHVARSISLLKNYLAMEDISLKSRSLQALGYILIARPDYMLEKDIGEILEASLSLSADSRIKIQALQNLYEYLVDAESQMGSDCYSKNTAAYSDAASYGVPVAAGAGDTNICGGIVQFYWNSILERSLDVNDQIRQSSLKIVEIVLRQGLVHPITCVPYLIALEIDPLEVNSKLAHHLLMNMNEKYPAFFESRLGDGLLMSFEFVHTMASSHNSIPGNAKGKYDSNPIVLVRPGISRIYRLIRANRASRNKFIHSIVRKFESGSWSNSQISFLVYCTEILASLPFTIPDEPLYLIYDINRVIQVKAGSVEANLKAWSSLVERREFANVPSECHDDGAKAGAPFVSKNNLSEASIVTPDSSEGISIEGLQKFQVECHEAIALQLLLKLKRYLKYVYGLNDARCQAFSLKEPPKPGETVSKQNIPFSVSDVTINLPMSYQAMVQKYQEFKLSLREDTFDYVAYTSSVKKKRPASTRSTRGGRAGRAKAGNNEDNDGDDEDWTGGARRLDFTNQSGIGVRVTRQRV